MAALSIVTTCKGRLHHLRQSLPQMLRQIDTQCIVVDYDCPDRCRDWVSRHHPSAQIVTVDQAPTFSASKARNLGAAAVSTPWIAFVDTDIVLADDFAARTLPLLVPGHFYRPAPVLPDTWGACIVAADDFRAIGGYDEVLLHWGGEDDDLYWRLNHLRACRPATFDAALLNAVEHDDRERMRFSDGATRWASQRANALYLHIKYDLMRQMGQSTLPADMLAPLYAEVRRIVLEGTRTQASRSQVTISLPDNLEVPLWGWRLNKSWTFSLEKIPGMGDDPFETTAS